MVLVKTLDIKNEIVFESSIPADDSAKIKSNNSEVGEESGTGEPRLVT